jgi:hypothetical protein
MDRIQVSSSNIVSVGYDAQIQTLEIEFLNGAIYQYLIIPERLYNGLMSASSHGRYFDAYIKKGGFDYIRIK